MDIEIIGIDETGKAENLTDELAPDLVRKYAEADAKAQQSKLRRGDQRGVADQPGGLFDAERGQRELFSDG